MGILPPFYTARYVEIHSSTLSCLWLLGGAGVVLWTLLVSLLGHHSYVERHAPTVDVAFWQDASVDGTWWPQLTTPSEYCGMSFAARYGGDMTWGSHSINCTRPEDELSQVFYASSNEVKVALSIAEGSNPQYNTSQVSLYEGMEKSSLTFEVSFSTVRETVSHVPFCQAFGVATSEFPEGVPIPSRYEDLVPDAIYGPGYLTLSVEDVVRAAGRALEDEGSEKAPLRLAGLEIVARVEVRNYVPYRWPLSAWNPLGLRRAEDLECSVRFRVLRDQFTPIQWFYEGKAPVALQHGLRLAVVGTGSVGYFSLAQLATQILLSFTAFGLAQTCLDYGWYYVHRQSTTIATRAFDRLDLQRPKVD